MKAGFKLSRVFPYVSLRNSGGELARIELTNLWKSDGTEYNEKTSEFALLEATSQLIVMIYLGGSTIL